MNYNDNFKFPDEQLEEDGTQWIIFHPDHAPCVTAVRNSA